MSSDWDAFVADSIAERKQAGRYRRRDAANIGRLVDFGSNDYLGLRRHPSVLKHLAPLREFGSGASPVLSGHGEHHTALETALAELCATESALVFSSGYGCNVGTIACLAQAGDLILSDSLNHASLIDGCRLSKATKKIFPHNDVGFVLDWLRRERHQFRRVMLVTESIFSMDGDQAELLGLVEVAEQYDCGLIVDEAHATGVYGRRGSGLVEALEIEERVFLKLGTLSKALGAIGGYACGSRMGIEFLVNYCRSYIFSTAPPVPVVLAANSAIGELSQMEQERQSLRRLSASLRTQIRGLGFEVPLGDSPIVPVILGSESKVLQASERLLAAGLYVPAIRPPTVPEGSCRLRISLSTSHTPADIDGLLAALGQLL